MSNTMWEGLGGPVRMDQADLGEIDPTLESCCRREVRVHGAPHVLHCMSRRFLTPHSVSLD